MKARNNVIFIKLKKWLYGEAFYFENNLYSLYIKKNSLIKQNHSFKKYLLKEKVSITINCTS